VGNETGISDAVVARSSLLAKEKLKPGLDLRLDTNQRVAVEIIGTSKRLDRSLSKVEAIPWTSIGGQTEAVQAIRDSIELPFLHAHLFKRFQHPVPKGFLLFGPPGCGKTLLGKATAHNLRLQIREETGEDHPEFFLNVKGIWPFCSSMKRSRFSARARRCGWAATFFRRSCRCSAPRWMALSRSKMW